LDPLPGRTNATGYFTTGKFRIGQPQRNDLLRIHFYDIRLTKVARKHLCQFATGAIHMKDLKPVIVRTYSAGVHFGYLVKRNGKEVTLERSRRIWRWFGAWTLSEVASSGVDVSQSKIGAPVSIVLTEAIEIIDCTPEAVNSLESARWSK
jgi:hypothetical protein